MVLRSRIKKLFPEELLKLIAGTCDTIRINSAHHKMKVIQQLLCKYDIRFSVLGGATNRLVLLIDGYTVKFAVDNQGYVDNLIEYSICRELQPYVTKTYETNGYILVAECVKTMTMDDFKLRRTDIESILSMLSQDYLLGDVGYIDTNYTNWGIRDDGSVVILDYAYIHRATEKLFSCEVCGCGILRYDKTFSRLKCSNTTACTAEFSYIERKAIQGDQVDLDMIEEAKEDSIKLTSSSFEVEVRDNDGILVKGNKIVISTLEEYRNYLLEVNNKMGKTYDEDEMFDLLVRKASARDPQELAEIEARIAELDAPESVSPEDIIEVDTEPFYSSNIPTLAEAHEMMEREAEARENAELNATVNCEVDDYTYDLSDMVDIARGVKTIDDIPVPERTDVSEDDQYCYDEGVESDYDTLFSAFDNQNDAEFKLADARPVEVQELDTATVETTTTEVSVKAGDEIKTTKTVEVASVEGVSLNGKTI